VSKVVVGIDGSPCSHTALDWAYAQARATAAELVIVHCWEYPYLGVIDFVLMVRRLPESTRPPAVAPLASPICPARAEHPVVDVRKPPVLLEGNPAWTLLDAAKDADLVVVGSRGRSGLKTLLLGSVSHVVVTHAEIPVVVVRQPAEAQARDE
jgi:nucleotide-binding universal stress UspA family protein